MKSKWDSPLEKTFLLYWRKKYDYPIIPQHRFHPKRQWLLDFAFPKVKLGIEIQGYGRGHTSYEGMSRDCEKNNEAVRHGWSILFLMSDSIKSEYRLKKACIYIRSIILDRETNIDFLRHLMTYKCTPTVNDLPPEFRK